MYYKRWTEWEKKSSELPVLKPQVWLFWQLTPFHISWTAPQKPPSISLPLSPTVDHQPLPIKSECSQQILAWFFCTIPLTSILTSKPMDYIQSPFSMTSARHYWPLSLPLYSGLWSTCWISLLFPSLIPFLQTTLMADFENFYS